jgi:hypothetical protein
MPTMVLDPRTGRQVWIKTRTDSSSLHQARTDLPMSSGSQHALTIAFVELVKILHEKRLVNVGDWDRLLEALDDLGDALPSQRGGIDQVADALRRPHPRAGGFYMASDPGADADPHGHPPR